MKEEPLSEGFLREFLLGNVNDEERQRIESLFLTDQLARERVLAAEEGLIDDYLDGSLTQAERKQFLKQYAETPAQQRKLKLARSIKEWATAEGNVSPAQPATVSVGGGWRERLRLRPAFVLPIAATVIVAIVASVVWLNSRIEQRNRRLTVQEELVKLNERSNLSEVPPQISLELKPGSLRSVKPEPELVIGPEIQVAELRLWLQETRYSSYRAVLRRVGSKELGPTVDLLPEADGRTIRLRLFTHLLTSGQYQVELGGVNADGAIDPTDEYHFTVRR